MSSETLADNTSNESLSENDPIVKQNVKVFSRGDERYSKDGNVILLVGFKLSSR
jgi:hypothetical protein